MPLIATHTADISLRGVPGIFGYLPNFLMVLTLLLTTCLFLPHTFIFYVALPFISRSLSFDRFPFPLWLGTCKVLVNDLLLAQENATR
jgi:hypothetical protein